MSDYKELRSKSTQDFNALHDKIVRWSNGVLVSLGSRPQAVSLGPTERRILEVEMNFLTLEGMTSNQVLRGVIHGDWTGCEFMGMPIHHSDVDVFWAAETTTARNNEIRQYRPAFFEGFDAETVAFDTWDEILAIPWVKKFSERPEFHQFSMSNNHLMAEYRGGREWWVCGIVQYPLPDAPQWGGGKT